MKNKIEFVKSIKSFGEDKLGLIFDGSFEELAKDEFSCNWVYACYKDKMLSVFKDNFPFEFYPDMNKALKRQKELAVQGYDTYFYHAEAHGGQACPITKEMLESDKARQCYVILHEAWHSTSRINKHNFPYSFEESSGRVVGLFGGIELARSINDHKLLKETIDQEEAWSGFADFVNISFKRLNALSLEKELTELKKELNAEAESLYRTLPDSWEKIELKKEINNAFILRYHDYTVHYPLAKRIFLKAGALTEAMKIYSELFRKCKTDEDKMMIVDSLGMKYKRE